MRKNAFHWANGSYPDRFRRGSFAPPATRVRVVWSGPPLSAQSAMQSKTAIGAFIRRIKSRLGAPTAINAGAHKLARLLYRMLKFGKAYVETGQQAYEKLFKELYAPQPSAQGTRTWLRRHSHRFHRISFLGDGLTTSHLGTKLQWTRRRI